MPSGLIQPVRPWGCQPCFRAARSDGVEAANRYSTLIAPYRKEKALDGASLLRAKKTGTTPVASKKGP
jgi:hypothetical protein